MEEKADERRMANVYTNVHRSSNLFHYLLCSTFRNIKRILYVDGEKIRSATYFMTMPSDKGKGTNPLWNL